MTVKKNPQCIKRIKEQWANLTTNNQAFTESISQDAHGLDGRGQGQTRQRVSNVSTFMWIFMCVTQ